MNSSQLQKKRDELDQINQKICQLLIKRLSILDDISLIKKSLGLETFDQERTNFMLSEIKCLLEKKEDKISHTQREVILKTFEFIFKENLNYLKSI